MTVPHFAFHSTPHIMPHIVESMPHFTPHIVESVPHYTPHFTEEPHTHFNMPYVPYTHYYAPYTGTAQDSGQSNTSNDYHGDFGLGFAVVFIICVVIILAFFLGNK